MNTLEGIAQRRPFHRIVIFLRDASGTYLRFPSFLNGMTLSQEPHSADKYDRRDPQAPMVLTGTLRNWNPRPACGTAIKSVRISISVFGLPGMSPQSASRGPVERGFVDISPARRCKCPQRTADGLCHKKWDVCLAHAFT